MAAHHDSETYRQVEITPQLQHRPAPPRDETRVLLMLAQTIAEQPDQSLQLLVDCAMRITSADSTGISIADVENNEDVFRWVATAGRFAPYLHTTLPRWFSPCGDTLRTGGVMLMREPARHYPYIASLGIPITEVLLSPIKRHGELVGTVWAALHDDRKRFDAEDARLLTGLTQFVGDTSDLLDRLSFGQTL